jgi:hypothetical protein
MAPNIRRISVPRQESILSVFVASPSDVAAERARLEEVISELNHSWSRSLRIRLDLVRWETHAYPGFAKDAQDVINHELPDDYDVFIGIMWHRFGTATDRSESGTYEEFLRAKAQWDSDNTSVRLMLYFKDAPIAPSQVDASQLEKVTAFRHSLGKEGGLYWQFQSPEDFVNLVRVHLTRVVQEWHAKTSMTSIPPATKGFGASPATSASDPHAEATEDEDIGLLELSELFEDSVDESLEVITRIVKPTELIGKRMEEHTRRLNAATAKGQLSRATARRMFAKVAKDMDDFASRIDQEVPVLDRHMKAGLGALSQAIALWSDLANQRAQLEGWLVGISSLKQTLSSVESQLCGFRDSVSVLPRLTTEISRAKRSVSAALQKLIDLVMGEQLVLSQMERSAQELLNTQKP